MKKSVMALDTDFQFYKDCGFDAVDFCLDKYFGKEESMFDVNTVTDEQIEKTFTEIKKAADAAGIEIYQTHAPFGDEFEDTANSVKCKIASIKATHWLGAKYCVVHPPIPDWRKYDIGIYEALDLAEDFYAKLIPTLEQYDVYCCTENMYASDKSLDAENLCPTTCSRAWEMVELCKRLGRKFKICLDIGHCVLTDDDPVKAIRECKDYLVALHCHDNDGVKDLHAYPLVDCGAPDNGFRRSVIDWQKIMRTLKAVGYNGTFNAECKLMGPAELKKDSYTYLSQIEDYLISL